ARHEPPSFPTRRSSDLDLSQKETQPVAVDPFEKIVRTGKLDRSFHACPPPAGANDESGARPGTKVGQPARRPGCDKPNDGSVGRSEEHTSELQSRFDLV